MAEQIQETQETVTEGNGVASRNRVIRNSDTSGASRAEQLIYLVLGVLEAILGLRVVLSLLGANASNGFANLIYSISYPFVSPFFGLFRYQFQAGVSRLEIETIVAMIVYGLVAWGIVQFTRIARHA